MSHSALYKCVCKSPFASICCQWKHNKNNIQETVHMPQPPLDETWELQWTEADHCIISSTSEQQWCTPLFLCLFLLWLCVVDVVLLFCFVSLLLVVYLLVLHWTGVLLTWDGTSTMMRLLEPNLVFANQLASPIGCQTTNSSTRPVFMYTHISVQYMYTPI